MHVGFPPPSFPPTSPPPSLPPSPSPPPPSASPPPRRPHSRRPQPAAAHLLTAVNYGTVRHTEGGLASYGSSTFSYSSILLRISFQLHPCGYGFTVRFAFFRKSQKKKHRSSAHPIGTRTRTVCDLSPPPECAEKVPHVHTHPEKRAERGLRHHTRQGLPATNSSVKHTRV